MEVINPLSSPSLIGSATTQGRGRGGQQGQLVLGQQLKALVVEVREGRQFVLDVGGNRLTASSNAPLSQGQALQLQVARTEPVIELKIIQGRDATPLAGRSLTLLGKSIDITPLMQSVRQLEPSVIETLSPATRNVLESFYSEQQNILTGKDIGPAFTQQNARAGQPGVAIAQPDLLGGQDSTPGTKQLTQDNTTVLKQLIEILGPNLENLPTQVGKSAVGEPLKAVLFELAQLFGKSEGTPERANILPSKLNEISSLIQTIQRQDPAILETFDPATRNIIDRFFASRENVLDGKDGGAVLKQLIDKLGLNLEHLLARGDKEGATQTLKSALLEVAHTFGTGDQIGGHASKLVRTLELFQLTQAQVGTENQLVIPLPLPFLEQGYLVIEREGKDGTSDGQAETESRFSLHLAMTDLGNLRIDFLKNTEGLFVRFAAQDKEKGDFLAEFADELKSSITGVPLIGLTFAGDAQDPAGDIIRRLIPKGKSMLDMKV